MDAPALSPDADAQLATVRRETQPERRARLIAAAETIFLRKGYHAATMDDIARQAGMSKKTVYQLFATKTALFDSFLTDRYSPFTIPIDAEGPPRAVLSAALCRLVGVALDPRQIALTRLLIAETPQSDDIVAALQRQCIEPGKNALQQWLSRQSELGALQVDDPKQAAATLFFAATGDFLFDLLLRTGRAPAPATLRAQVERAVAMVFGPDLTARP